MPATSYNFEGAPMMYYQTTHIASAENVSATVTLTKLIQPEECLVLAIPILLDESYYTSSYQYTRAHTFNNGSYIEYASRKYLGSYSIQGQWHDSIGNTRLLGALTRSFNSSEMTVLRALSYRPCFMIIPFYRDIISHPAESPDQTYKTNIGFWIQTNFIIKPQTSNPPIFGHYSQFTNMGDNFALPDMTGFRNRTITGTSASWNKFNLDNNLDINPLLIFSDGSTYNETTGQIRKYTLMDTTDISETDITASHTQYTQYIFDLIHAGDPWVDPVDPNDDSDPMDEGGNSDSDEKIGGDGTFDFTSDTITPPNLPTLTATESGFVKIYNPTQSQLKEISNYCWSDSVIVNALQALFGSPINGIISIHTIPSNIPNAVMENFSIAGIATTSIMVNMPTSQYVTVDCGNVDIENFTGTFLDYSPHTKCSIYLPYLGYRDISVDEIMGKTLNVKYIIDIVNGSFVCFIQANGSLITQYNGNCAMTIPLTSVDYTSFFTNTVSMASTIAGGYASGNPTGSVLQGMMSAGQVMASKPDISKSGNFGGSTGIMGYQKPYLIITTPTQNKPSQQKEMYGYPCNMSKTLKSLKGYTKVSEIKLENIQGTDEEKREIMALLKGGVFL